MKRRIGALCLALLMMVTLMMPMVSMAAAKAVSVSSVTVSPGSASLYVGDTKKLTPKVNPVAKVSQKVTYKSSKTSVATVSKAGVVTAKGPGTAKITVTSSANKKKTKTITVTVKRRPKLRVLAVGNYTYYKDSLEGPKNDVANMHALYSMSKLAGKKAATISVKANRTVKQIKSDIETTFKGAVEGDVSVFYYSGHGVANQAATGDYAIAGVDFNGYTGYYFIKDLRAKLQTIKGTVVVIMDSCFSGAFPVGKSASTAASDFNRAVVNEFGASSKAINNKFRVLTACKYNQVSHEFKDSNGYAYGLLTQAILESLVSWNSSGQAMLSLPGDANGDRIIQLRELYKSTSNWVNKAVIGYNKQVDEHNKNNPLDRVDKITNSDVQVFPSNNTFAVFDFR